MLFFSYAVIMTHSGRPLVLVKDTLHSTNSALAFIRLQVLDLQVVKNLTLSSACNPSALVHLLPVLSSHHVVKQTLVTQSHPPVRRQKAHAPVTNVVSCKVDQHCPQVHPRNNQDVDVSMDLVLAR